MRISIQTIVFNAVNTLPEGMLQKNIEQWLGVADEIIIVEGATRSTGRFDGDTSTFTSDGKSTDGTRKILQALSEKYSQIKLILGDGFWNGKTSMCNAAASIATGDYLWQVDNDEFYHEKDIPVILELLDKQRPNAVHFYAYHFWGGYDTYMDNNQVTWGNDIPWRRIFRHTLGSHWISHEPPDYQLADGLKCNMGKVITRDDTNALGVKLYHYGYVDKKQALFKSAFYRNPAYPALWEQWKADNNTRIFGAKTSQFTGDHPAILSEGFNSSRTRFLHGHKARGFRS